jgi:hypothetical protein
VKPEKVLELIVSAPNATIPCAPPCATEAMDPHVRRSASEKPKVMTRLRL